MLPALIIKSSLRSHRSALSLLSVISVAVIVVGAIVSIKISQSAADSSTAVGLISNSSFKCSATGSNATVHVAVPRATPNGSGDDFAAIQAAIDAAGRRGGGVVSLPAGTFIINSHLVLKNNVKLTGVGPATVIKAGPKFMSSQGPGGGYPIITTAGASNTTIADLTADQSGNTLNGNVNARLSGYVVEGLDSNNVVIDGVHVRNPFTYSIAIAGSTDFCVENSNIQVTTGNRYNQLDGIHILDSNSGQVINNIIRSEDDGLVAHTIGAPVYNVLYANNVVHGEKYGNGLQLAVGDFPIYDIKIENNDFYGSLFGIRTGYYDDRTGAVHNIAISENYIHSFAMGRESPAIKIGGFGGLGPIKDVAIINNQTCNAGTITVQSGQGNVVEGTTVCQ